MRGECARARAAVETVKVELDRLGETAYKGRGFGIEAEDLKDYEPGDDYRYIDWRATARRPPTPLGPQLSVREKRKEVALEVSILVDASASMGYGEKWPNALSLVGTVMEVVRGSDKITVTVYSNGKRAFVRHVPRHGGRATPIITDICAKVRPRGTFNLVEAAKAELSLNRRRRLHIVITDFAHRAEDVRSASAMLLAGGYLTMLMVLDPQELSVPLTAPTALVDPETGRRIAVSGGEWGEVAVALRRHVESIVGILRGLGVPHVVVGPRKWRLPISEILSMVASSRMYAYR